MINIIKKQLIFELRFYDKKLTFSLDRMPADGLRLNSPLGDNKQTFELSKAVTDEPDPIHPSCY